MLRTPIIHVVIMDGTLSSLSDRFETNAGLTYKLLRELPGHQISLTYEAGIQWCNWRSVIDLAAGVGINAQIRRAYSAIASRYRPGDRIFFFGFSRGAYAVRSLAGVIDRIGLLTPEYAVERNIRQVFRNYRRPGARHAQKISPTMCQPNVTIEMIGVWDTVKALGIQYPLLWRLAPTPTDFHDHGLGQRTKSGYQALAMDENRRAFAPILWRCKPEWTGHLEQVWFRGAHADVGGHIGDFPAARPLSNIPLLWMLERAAEHGLPLPKNWQSRFPIDAQAPAYGPYRGLARFFLFRRKRVQLSDPSERIYGPTTKTTPSNHPSPQAFNLPG